MTNFLKKFAVNNDRLSRKNAYLKKFAFRTQTFFLIFAFTLDGG